MKEFKILMDKHQNLEAAKLEYEERGKLKEDIWEKIKECEMSIQALSKDNNRNLIINQMIESHPYMPLVVWFMEKKEELSRKISNNLFSYQSSKEREYELFSDDLEMLFSRVEDVLISKYHKEGILKKVN